MPRKRRPVQMPIAEATEAVVWRATFLLEAMKLSARTTEAEAKLREAIEDYSASKNPQPFEVYICHGCGGPCTELFSDLCKRCDVKASTIPRTLSFTELQS